MSTLSIVLLVILVILIIALVALYFFGKKAQKKQEEQQAQIEAAALVCPQSCIKPAVCEQALVITFLNNAPFVDDNQPIHRRDG